MKGLQDKRGKPRLFIESAQSDTGGLLKSGFFSVLLHLAIVVFVILNLKPTMPKDGLSVYRVTIKPYAPLGAIQSATPGGSPGGTPISKTVEQMKPDERSKGSKVGEKPKQDRKEEKSEKRETLPTAKKQKLREPLTKDEIKTGMKSPSEKGEKPKKESYSNTSLQEAIEDIHIKAALDKIQKKVAHRDRVEEQKTEVKSAGRQTTEGQPPVGPSEDKKGSSFSTGSGSGVGIGPGAGGYPIGGVPWGSPQGSTAKSSILDDYYSMIWAKIKMEWTIPEDLPKGKTDLEAIIIFVLEKNGKIQKSWFEKRSGNTLYDQSAMRAIKKAEPFPPFPKEISDNTFEFGIRFYPD